MTNTVKNSVKWDLFLLGATGISIIIFFKKYHSLTMKHNGHLLACRGAGSHEDLTQWSIQKCFQAFAWLGWKPPSWLFCNFYTHQHWSEGVLFMNNLWNLGMWQQAPWISKQELMIILGIFWDSFTNSILSLCYTERMGIFQMFLPQRLGSPAKWSCTW